MGAVKLLAVSTVGVVWVAMMCRLVGPAAYLSLADWLPRVYVAMASWLTPPYLYLIINGIILSIAASSRFSPAKSVPFVKDSVAVPVPVQDSVQVPVPGPVPVLVPLSVPLPDPVSVEVPSPVPVQVPVPTPVPVPSQAQKPMFEISDLDEEEDFVIRGPRWGVEDMKEEEVVVAVPSPPVYNIDVVSLADPVVRTDFTEMSNEYARPTESAERPPVSARFGRKGVRPSPEGKKALRVAKSRKGETLESTWRAITEGRAMPLTRHLKKSDTWETRVPRNGSDEVAPPPGAAMRKAETFHERGGGVESPVLGSGGERKIKREPSLGQDDLNRRVEAFIKKFNEEMRMQRQESFKHYMDMINRGADQ